MLYYAVLVILPRETELAAYKYIDITLRKHVEIR